MKIKSVIKDIVFVNDIGEIIDCFISAGNSRKFIQFSLIPDKDKIIIVYSEEVNEKLHD